MKYRENIDNKIMISIGKILLLVMVIVGLIYCPGEGKCPSRNEVQPLDLNQFTGNWYMVAGTPVNGKSLSRCGHFVVKAASDDTFTMNYTAVSNKGNNQPVVFFVNARVDDDISGNWQLRGSKRILGPFKHRIIAVDYDSYIAFVVCGDTNQILRSREFSMIWSRSRNLPLEILNKLKDNIARYVKRSDILYVDHANC